MERCANFIVAEAPQDNRSSIGKLKTLVRGKLTIQRRSIAIMVTQACESTGWVA